MSIFSGPQGKGAMRRHREGKRSAAAERADNVTHIRTKAHRLFRCSCTAPEGRLLRAIFGDQS